MLLARRLFLGILACGLILTLLPAPSSAALPPLIPRVVLFGNPWKTSPVVSPDGSKLAYLAPDSNGVVAIWVKTIGKDDDQVVASDAQRPIRNVAWQPDGKHVLYVQDKNGDDNAHVFQTDLTSGVTNDLTPFPGVKGGILDINTNYPTSILIYMNKRNKSEFDVYRCDLTTGASTLDTQNPGNVAGWVADNQQQVRAGLVQNQDGSNTIIVRDTPKATWRILATYSPDDGAPTPEAFSADNLSLYVSTPAGANAAQLLRYNVHTGKSTVAYGDPTFDVGGVLVDNPTRKVVAALVQRDRDEWELLDPAFADDFAAIKALHDGDFSFTSQSSDGRFLVVDYLLDNGPVSFYLYDRQTKKGTLLFVNRPELAQYKLASMQPVSFKARDGLTIHGYLTLPVGLDPKGLPMIVLVHGGPWARDTWGYDGTVQWLANRGYAVLQVNYRGSTGYGKAFLNAGNRQWAGAMATDLLDAKDWAVGQGYADPKRVGIMGSSYGGYAALAGLAFAPDAFGAGVDIVGMANLNTYLASYPANWTTGRAMFSKRMGATTEFLNSQSPLFKADQIKAPLLIGQGATDTRVTVSESDQIVAAVRKSDHQVEYVVFPDEGHGFAKSLNNRRFNAATEAFLAKYLGGRFEPAGPDESIAAFLK
jgi:dipeptidyl aminopeptidase/acylaminoacyl peptidase